MSASASAPAPAADPFSPFTAEHEELRASIRRFVERELVPHVDEWERSTFPNEVFTKMAASGFLGLKYPAEHGGEGGDFLHEAVLTEELGRCGSGGLAAGIGAHIEIATPPIWKFGTDDQKVRYLEPAIRGEKIGALAITEPEAGSDVASVRTKATRVEGGWSVSGEKLYITNGVRADFYVMAVKTTDEGGHHGMSFLIVDQQDAIDARPLEKMGWHASDTASVALQDAFVPEENLLGELDGAFKLIMANFQWERLSMSLGTVASMQLCFEQTLEYARERRAFGRPIGSFQTIRHQLADVATTIHTSRCLTYDALRRFAAGQDATQQVTMAKLVTQRAAVEVTDTCVQIHGGAGYMREYGIERMYRDARLGPIGGGTDEIMREILGRSLGV
ncbi:MAG TPA: acyl-CoA dehydrogenase family protein [Solirubrobacteraceae bacterium]|nr:acyl-CoA dehydrogenase family protein [Solirubrobacteraceae bacterium]